MLDKIQSSTIIMVYTETIQWMWSEGGGDHDDTKENEAKMGFRYLYLVCLCEYIIPCTIIMHASTS